MFRYGPSEGTATHTVYSRIARPVSKHAAEGKGKVRLNSNSSLRKLMRAARRGKLPDGRAVLIEQTQAIAARHPTLHMSPAAKRRYLVSRAAS